MSTVVIEFVYPACVNCGTTFGVSKPLWDNRSGSVRCPQCGKLARWCEDESPKDRCKRLTEQREKLEQQVRGYRNYFAGLRRRKER